MAEGKRAGEIVLILFGVTQESDGGAYRRGMAKLRKWQALPGFAECYRAIVREIARRHQVEIDVRSEIGRGTEFTFRFSAEG